MILIDQNYMLLAKKLVDSISYLQAKKKKYSYLSKTDKQREISQADPIKFWMCNKLIFAYGLLVKVWPNNSLFTFQTCQIHSPRFRAGAQCHLDEHGCSFCCVCRDPWPQQRCAQAHHRSVHVHQPVQPVLGAHSHAPRVLSEAGR